MIVVIFCFFILNKMRLGKSRFKLAVDRSQFPGAPALPAWPVIGPNSEPSVFIGWLFVWTRQHCLTPTWSTPRSYPQSPRPENDLPPVQK